MVEESQFPDILQEKFERLYAKSVRKMPEFPKRLFKKKHLKKRKKKLKKRLKMGSTK